MKLLDEFEIKLTIMEKEILQGGTISSNKKEETPRKLEKTPQTQPQNLRIQPQSTQKLEENFFETLSMEELAKQQNQDQSQKKPYISNASWKQNQKNIELQQKKRQEEVRQLVLKGKRLLEEEEQTPKKQLRTIDPKEAPIEGFLDD